MSKNYFKSMRAGRKKRNRIARKRLFPGSWFDYKPVPGGGTLFGMYKAPPKEELEAYFQARFGNVYTREVTQWDPLNKYLPSTKSDNHMLLGFMIGNGSWMSIDWLDLQTNRKWTESIRIDGPDYEHNSKVTWLLVSEMMETNE